MGVIILKRMQEHEGPSVEVARGIEQAAFSGPPGAKQSCEKAACGSGPGRDGQQKTFAAEGRSHGLFSQRLLSHQVRGGISSAISRSLFLATLSRVARGNSSTKYTARGTLKSARLALQWSMMRAANPASSCGAS